MSREIPLTQGKIAILDDEDYGWLSSWGWYAMRGRYTFYAYRKSATVNGKNRVIAMHREILGLEPDDGLQADHINGNGLDNRRANLRQCTNGENGRNSRKRKNNTSGYMGVRWDKRDRKWRAQICYRDSQHFLGCFDDLEDAARAYDRGALKYHGEFATLNFPQEDARGC